MNHPALSEPIAFMVQKAPFVVEKAPFVVPKAPFVVQKASFVVQNAPFAVQKASFMVEKAFVNFFKTLRPLLRFSRRVLTNVCAYQKRPANSQCFHLPDHQ